jgi:hypothetical protein
MRVGYFQNRLLWISVFAAVAALVLLSICWFVLGALFNAVAALATFDAEKTRLSVVTVASIGFLSMSLIQAIRMVFPVRSWFQEHQVRRWAARAAPVHKSDHRSRGHAFKWEDRQLKHLLQLTNVANRVAFFDMPIEQVCGQFSAVSEVVLADPKRHVGLLAVLAGAAGRDDVRELRKSYYESEDARSRLAYHVQRNIDNLQITVSTGWRRALRLSAMLASATIALPTARRVVLSQYCLDERINVACAGKYWHLLLVAIIVGIVAGFLASVFRDVIAIVERLRRA